MVNSLDRDKFGHCVRCHKYLIREVIDRGKVIKAPTSDSDSEVFFLNNYTNMRVSICSKCKQNLKEEDFEYIMDAIIKGWDWETTQLVNDSKKELWNENKKKSYMDKHRLIKIVSLSNGLNNKVKINKLNKFNSKNKRVK